MTVTAHKEGVEEKVLVKFLERKLTDSVLE
jgi:hypothetical protein